MAIDKAIESMWNIYNNINDLIKFSDTKAGLILASNGAILSVIFINAIDRTINFSNYFLFLLFLSIGLTFGVLSIIISIFSIKPNLIEIDDRSLIYFGTISQKYRKESKYHEKVFETFNNETLTLGQISDEVWIISGIALKKYKLINLSTWFLLGEMISFYIAAIILIILKYLK
jgi:hypothetical protein